MATRAVYSFTGFPGVPERHLYLHHDGYPTGAAWRFATALRQRPEPGAFAAAFLATQPGADPLVAPEQAADAEYRYQVQLLAGDAARSRCRPGGGCRAAASGSSAAGRCPWSCSSGAFCRGIRCEPMSGHGLCQRCGDLGKGPQQLAIGADQAGLERQGGRDELTVVGAAVACLH